jgi:hypothetical protein
MRYIRMEVNEPDIEVVVSGVALTRRRIARPSPPIFSLLCCGRVVTAMLPRASCSVRFDCSSACGRCSMPDFLSIVERSLKAVRYGFFCVNDQIALALDGFCHTPAMDYVDHTEHLDPDFEPAYGSSPLTAPLPLLAICQPPQSPQSPPRLRTLTAPPKLLSAAPRRRAHSRRPPRGTSSMSKRPLVHRGVCGGMWFTSHGATSV